MQICETAHYTLISAECNGSLWIACGFSSAHRCVFCEFMYSLRWNYASSVNYMRSRIPGCSTINCWNQKKIKHMSLLVHWKQLVSYWHCNNAVSLSWQLFNTWCRVVRSLGKVYLIIWKVMPAAIAVCPVLSDQTASGPPACWFMRLPVVSNFFTNFWIYHFDSAALPPDLFWSAVYDFLNNQFSSICKCTHALWYSNLSVTRMKQCAEQYEEHWDQKLCKAHN